LSRQLCARYHRECLNDGVFCAPSPFEAGFISTAQRCGHRWELGCSRGIARQSHGSGI